MSSYLLIESRDPFTSPAVAGHVELAAGLRRGGSEVAIYLVQDGVLPCRAGADGEALHEALAAGVEVARRRLVAARARHPRRGPGARDPASVR